MSRTDTLTSHRLLEVGEKLYAPNGANIFQSSDHAGSWRKLEDVPDLEDTRIRYAFKVGDQLLVKGVGGGVYTYKDTGWHQVFNGNGLPSSNNAYAVSAGGNDYVCSMTAMDFAYGFCQEVGLQNDTLRIRRVSFSEPAYRAHFSSGDTLYVMRSHTQFSEIHPVAYSGTGPIQRVMVPSTTRFVFFDGAVILSSFGSLYKVSGSRAERIHELDYVVEGTSALSLNNKGYGILKKIGPNLLLAGAGTELSYVHEGRAGISKIPFFNDKHALDVHVSEAFFIVATREGIFRSRIER